MTQAAKKALIRNAKQYASLQAKNTALRKLGKPTEASKYDDASAKSIIRFETEVNLARQDGSLKQDEVIDILKQMALDGYDDGTLYDLYHSRYESDKNNPYAKYK